MPSFKTSPYPLERFYPKIVDTNETYGTDPNAVNLERMPTIRQLAQEDAMNGSQGYNPMQQASWNNQAGQFIQQQQSQEQEDHVLSQLPKLDTSSEGGKQALNMLLRFNPDAANSPRLRGYLATQEALVGPKKGEIPRGVADAIGRFRSIDYRSPDAVDKIFEAHRGISAEDAADPNVVKSMQDALNLANRTAQREQDKLAKEQALKDKLDTRPPAPADLIDRFVQMRTEARAPISDEDAVAKAIESKIFVPGSILGIETGSPTPQQIEQARALMRQERQAAIQAEEEAYAPYYRLPGSNLKPTGQPTAKVDPYTGQPTGAPAEAGTPEQVQKVVDAPKLSDLESSKLSIARSKSPNITLEQSAQLQQQAENEARLNQRTQQESSKWSIAGNDIENKLKTVLPEEKLRQFYNSLLSESFGSPSLSEDDFTTEKMNSRINDIIKSAGIDPNKPSDYELPAGWFGGKQTNRDVLLALARDRAGKNPAPLLSTPGQTIQAAPGVTITVNRK